MARGAVEANSCSTVVDILAAVVAGPAVDTHAGMAANCVEAGAPIVAGVGLHETLVDVLSTVLPWSGYSPQEMNSRTLRYKRCMGLNYAGAHLSTLADTDSCRC